jgi:hypothetical protein
MGLFLEIAQQYQLADAAFAAGEQDALDKDDEAAFDQAGDARMRNDQAYFLYLFTRLEAAVNEATEALLAARLAASAVWAERRIWQAWSREGVRKVAFLSKVEVLTDKGQQHYAEIKEYYDGRNDIAHGGVWEAQFFVPSVAQSMSDLVRQFATN